MSGYVKIFSDIVGSSVWKDPDAEVAKLWVTMLALSEPDGYLRGTPGWLAYQAKISIEKCQEILTRFLNPDIGSRTAEYEGRKIKSVEDGWVILNYVFYRNNRTTREIEPLGDRLGLIYYAVDGNEVKIGFSINPWARQTELRCARPNLTIVATEKGTIATEKLRHTQFSQWRLKGEWFRKSPEINTFIESLTDKSDNNGSVATKTTRSYRSATTASASASAYSIGIEEQNSEKLTCYHKDSRTVLHVLNEATGKKFREVDSNLSVISARLREPEITLEGVKSMIGRQCQKWKNTDMAEYLRPETLFGKTKFEGYYAAKDMPVIHEGNGHVSIADLRAGLKIKQEQAREIKNRYTFRDAMGDQWQDADKRKEYRAMCADIEQLERRIADAVNKM